MPFKDPETRRAYHKAYSARHYRDNKDAYAERHAEWKVANPGRTNEYTRRWRAANPEKQATAQRAWREANPDAAREITARYRARKRNAPEVEKIDRLALYERDGGRCHLCGKHVPRAKFTLDHLIPLAHGGSHTALNLAVAHGYCNQQRSDGLIPAQLRLH